MTATECLGVGAVVMRRILLLIVVIRRASSRLVVVRIMVAVAPVGRRPQLAQERVGLVPRACVRRRDASLSRCVRVRHLNFLVSIFLFQVFSKLKLEQLLL